MTQSSTPFDYSQLTPKERILLAQELWDSAFNDLQDFPLTDDQMAEIERRMAAVDAGQMPTYPWEEVKQRLRNLK